jgi:hypothetical protein
MVDEEWLELALEDIRDFVRGTFLEEAPIAPVSSETKQGIPEFIEALNALAAKIPERPPTDLFRLPIDRVFTMKGFGTVITGTLISGRVQVGDTIRIYPSEITSKVRWAIPSGYILRKSHPKSGGFRFTTKVPTKPQPACEPPLISRGSKKLPLTAVKCCPNRELYWRVTW